MALQWRRILHQVLGNVFLSRPNSSPLLNLHAQNFTLCLRRLEQASNWLLELASLMRSQFLPNNFLAANFFSAEMELQSALDFASSAASDASEQRVDANNWLVQIFSWPKPSSPAG